MGFMKTDSNASRPTVQKLKPSNETPEHRIAAPSLVREVEQPIQCVNGRLAANERYIALNVIEA
jgi:hypothetical protein